MAISNSVRLLLLLAWTGAAIPWSGCSEPQGEVEVRVVSQVEVAEPGGAGGAPLLVDVRTDEEFAAGHVPGALHIPHSELRDRLPELGARDREVIVYCQSGRRAGIAAEILTEEGFEVGHLDGDMSGWIEAGLPVEVGP